MGDDDDIFAAVHRDLAESRERKRAGRRDDYNDRQWKRRARECVRDQRCVGCLGVGRKTRATIADHINPDEHHVCRAATVMCAMS